MNGMSRFLSRREKHHEKRSYKNLRNKSHQPPTKVPSELYKVFTNEDQKAADKDGEKKIKMLVSRLQGSGITTLTEEHAQHALTWYPDDLDKAYDLLVLANESFEGELKDYNPDVTMVGAINRNMVTCYLDALLFAMFARLDSFEAMVYDEFTDEPRKKLAAILRLWVNLLRTGQLIRVELTKHLQDALAKCGWEEAALVCQQDASEAFTFITGALELPLLTLKMDIYHTGREDKEDDHKFVNERLLEVALPEPEEAGDTGVTLEDCLETYFNNRIEVKRYLQRQNTMTSVVTLSKDPEKSEALHIETVELTGPDTPIVETPVSFGPTSPLTIQPPAHPLPIRPLHGRRRGDSIFAEKYTVREKSVEEDRFDEKKLLDEILNGTGGRPRSASLLRKEIMMPAWQFFSLIPWYTDNVPSTDAQVAAHFSAKRPVLGICLKRYTMLPDGTPRRLDTFVDIPLEIGFPSFISDERMHDDGPLFGNFKLVLQSVVCHRGVSIHSGHYVSLVRANKPPSSDRPGPSQPDDNDDEDSWLRFDDLANPRVSEVDIQAALRAESPYLLFYQVQPINEELASRGDPPSYAEAQVVDPIAEASPESIASDSAIETETEGGGEWEKVSVTDADTSVKPSEPVSRSSISSIRRDSISIDELAASVSGSMRGRTEPSTPDDQKATFMSTSRRNSKAWLSATGNNKSRPGSQSGENRLSLTLSRLTGRGSKEKLHLPENVSPEDALIIAEGIQSAQGAGDEQQKSEVKEKGTLGRSKSKKEKKDEKRHLRSKSREPRDVLAGKGKFKVKERPDRECVVM